MTQLIVGRAEAQSGRASFRIEAAMSSGRRFGQLRDSVPAGTDLDLAAWKPVPRRLPGKEPMNTSSGPNRQMRM
jgi:hypothetical protein